MMGYQTLQVLSRDRVDGSEGLKNTPHVIVKLWFLKEMLDGPLLCNLRQYPAFAFCKKKVVLVVLVVRKKGCCSWRLIGCAIYIWWTKSVWINLLKAKVCHIKPHCSFYFNFWSYLRRVRCCALKRVRVERKSMCEYPNQYQLFIDGTAALYIGETQIKELTNEGDQRVGTCWLEE